MMSVRRVTIAGFCSLACTLGLCSSAQAVLKHAVVRSFSLAPIFEEGGVRPTAVAVDPVTGDIYVVALSEHKVFRLDSEGNPVDFSALNSDALSGADIPPPYTPEESTIRFSSGARGEVAIDRSGGLTDGDIYVTDVVHKVVDIFAQDGTFLGQLTGTSSESYGGNTCGVTVDASGKVYVADESGRIDEYTPTANPVSNSDYVGSMVTSPAEVCRLAVDSTGKVLYADEPDGALLDSSLAGPPFATFDSSNVVDVAVDPGNGDVYSDEERIVAVAGVSPEIPGHIVEYDSAGNVLNADPFPGSVESFGVAVNSANKDVYVSESESIALSIFGPGVLFPTGFTGEATGVESTSATLTGSINPESETMPASYYFRYGPTADYGSQQPASPGTNVGTGESYVAASAEVTGLEPNATYHYQLDAVNENGINPGEDRTFTTSAIAPSFDTPPSSSDPTRASVVIEGAVNPEKSPTTAVVEYVDHADYQASAENPYAAGGRTDPQNVGGALGNESIVSLLTGLTPNTTYDYAIVAHNQAGLVTGQNGQFTTGPGTVPLVSTGAASGVAQNIATISGTVDTQGLPTTYGFEIGTVAGEYGPPTGLGAIGAGALEATVSLSLTGLLPGTTYHYRLTANNVDGSNYGTDQSFTTSTFTNVLVAPPAPLAFVTVPSIAFPAEVTVKVVKKKAKGKKKAVKHKTVKKKKPSDDKKGKRK